VVGVTSNGPALSSLWKSHLARPTLSPVSDKIHPAAAHELDPFSTPHGSIPNPIIGREEILNEIDRRLNRMSAGRFAATLVLSGCRGVGKTVLLRLLHQIGLERGWITVWLDCSQMLRHSGSTSSLSHSIDVALRRTEGRRPRSGAVSQSFTARARGHLPFVDLELDGEFKFGDGELGRQLGRLGRVATELDVPILILIDEGELIEGNTGHILMTEVMGQASRDDLPIGAFVAGTGLSWIPSLVGLASFPAWLCEIERVRRLTDAQAIELLIETAALRGLSWSASDLKPIVRASHGVPRLLQTAGSFLFQFDRQGIPVPDAVASVVPRLMGQQRLLISMLTREQREVLMALSEAGPIAVNAGEVKARVSMSRKRFFDRIEELELVGMIEASDSDESNSGLYDVVLPVNTTSQEQNRPET